MQKRVLYNSRPVLCVVLVFQYLGHEAVHAAANRRKAETCPARLLIRASNFCFPGRFLCTFLCSAPFRNLLVTL